MSDWPWVIAAYGLTWVVLAVYTIRIGRGLARARAELEEKTTSSEAGTRPGVPGLER